MEKIMGVQHSAGFNYGHPEEIWEEMREMTPDFYGSPMNVLIAKAVSTGLAQVLIIPAHLICLKTVSHEVKANFGH